MGPAVPLYNRKPSQLKGHLLVEKLVANLLRKMAIKGHIAIICHSLLQPSLGHMAHFEGFGLMFKNPGRTADFSVRLYYFPVYLHYRLDRVE